jgi:hypothetical protein
LGHLNRLLLPQRRAGFLCALILFTISKPTLRSFMLLPQNRDGSRNIMDDFREAYFWLLQNTAEDATVCVHAHDEITFHSYLFCFCHSTGHVLV